MRLDDDGTFGEEKRKLAHPEGTPTLCRGGTIDSGIGEMKHLVPCQRLCSIRPILALYAQVFNLGPRGKFRIF